MKRATPALLRQADLLLAGIRSLGGQEVKPGVFHHRGRALLHFHAEGGLLYCDLKERGDWVRYPVGTPSADSRLLSAVGALLVA